MAGIISFVLPRAIMENSGRFYSLSRGKKERLIQTNRTYLCVLFFNTKTLCGNVVVVDICHFNLKRVADASTLK